MPSLPTDVVLREVGLRDGLQSIQTILPTDRKIEWIRDAYAAGQRDIEVGSFVPARVLPQLADTADVLGCMRALLDAGADRVNIADTVGYAGPA